jgi:probable F420-dependent oxidoreductase
VTSQVDKWGVGLHYGGTDQSMGLVDLALAAEQRGLDSLFVPEHTHIPADRRTPYPSGGEIPGRYLRLWDPLVGLSFVAASTSLVVGTCVALPGGHDPIAYAKAVATLDVMSGGRFVFGIGFGWNREEFESHGFPADVRRDVVMEKLAMMKAIWTQDVASYVGQHLQLEPSWSWPKPLQRPHPPVLLGGTPTPSMFRQIAESADGWIPTTMTPSATLDSELKQLAAAWERVGRVGAPHVMVMQRPEASPVLRSVLARYRDLGVNRVLIDVPTEGREALLPILDGVAAALAAA